MAESNVRSMLVNQETVERLEALLAEARRGGIRGLVYCVKDGPGSHRVGFTGQYLDNALEAIGAGARIQHEANVRARLDCEIAHG